MIRKTLTILISFLFMVASANAVRVLEILERSHELRLSRVALPEATNGTVGFSRCDTCAREFLSVDSATVYLLDGKTVTLADMRLQAARILQSAAPGDMTLVVVHFDPDTEVATRIRIERP